MKQRRGAIIAIVASIFTLLQPLSAFGGQVTNGLLVDLNIANPSSYSGSGTTVNDSVGTNNTATLVNGPTYQSSGGAGIVTDGVDDYLEISNTSELQPALGTSYTLQMWARVNTFTAGKGLLSKQFGVGGDYDGYSLMLSGTNGLSLFMNGQSINGSYSSANNVFSLNTWTLFTAIVRFGGGATNQSKIYVNGTEVLTASNSESGIPRPAAPIRLASGLHEGTPYSALKIGAFAFYNRALTPSEISDNYDYYLNYVPDNTAPTITSQSTFTVQENQSSITTLTANETSTWTLRPSTDSATVNLNSSSGALTFKNAPNFEAPIDSNSDNSYQISVRATDGAGNFSELALTVSVSDLDESTSLSITFSTPPRKGISTTITATLSSAGNVTFLIGGKRIPGCSSKASSGSPAQVSCSWRPAVAGAQLLTARLTPTSQSLTASSLATWISIAPRASRR
jgi:hypothetical protein